MINKGDKITKQSLLSLLTSRYDVLIGDIVNFIPLGFNELYTITAEKIFNKRPKVIQNTYSTRSGSILDINGGDVSQSNIGAAYLGSPYTLELGEALGLSTYANSALGLSAEPFIKSEPLLAYNPTTDLIGGGVPFHGNSPFIWRGFMAFSNSIEDTNVRTQVSSDGTTFNLKAKSISVMVRAQSTADFTIGTDSMSAFTDRTNLELKHLQGVNLNATSADIVSGSGAGDYLVWLIYNATTLDSKLIMVKWDADYTMVNGILNKPYSAYFTDYAGYRYTRPIAVTYYNGTNFITSTQEAWGEAATTVNAEPTYGKLYQQVSSPNPIIRENTSSNDRRIIPSNYYIDTKNNSIIGKTVYSGLIRHIPGASGNRITMQVQAGNYSTLGSYKLDIDQCELTDGSTSIWVKDLDLPTLTISAVNDLTFAEGGSHPNTAYIWLCADPTSVLDPTGGETNNLRLKLVYTKRPTWDSDWNHSDNFKRHGNVGLSEAIDPKYTHRCRIGWLNLSYLVSPGDDSAGGYIMRDGVYTLTNDLKGKTNTGLSSLYGLAGGWTIGTGATTGGTYSILTTGTGASTVPLHFLPYYGSMGTSLACTELKIGLAINSGISISMGTAPWVAISTTNNRYGFTSYSEGTLGTTPSVTGAYQDNCCLAYSAQTTSGYGIVNKYNIMSLPFSVDGSTKLMYSGTGLYNEGNSLRAIVMGFTLPIGAF